MAGTTLKMAITGKGGVGKTTLAILLIRLYAVEGSKVFVANLGHNAMLGVSLV